MKLNADNIPNAAKQETKNYIFIHWAVERKKLEMYQLIVSRALISKAASFKQDD